MKILDTKKWTRRTALTILSSGIIAAACFTAPMANAQDGEPIKIGAFFSTTGSIAGGGSEALVGAQILIEEVNASGGVNGRPIELIHVDDESRPEVAVSQLKRLIKRDGVVAIAGPASTVVSASLSPILNEYKVAAVGCICYVGPITPYEFSSFPLRGVMDTFAKFVMSNGKKKIGVLLQSGSLAEVVERGMLPLLKKYDVEIVGIEQFQANDTDVTPLLARLKSKGAEVIFGAASGAPAALLVKNFKQVDYPGLFWTFGGNATATFIDLIGESADVVNMGGYKILVYRDLPNSDPMKERLVSFVKRYKEITGKEPGLYATFGYDTVLSLVEAIRKVGPNPEKIRDALENQTNLQALNGLINRSKADHNGMETDWVAVQVNGAEKRYQLAQ